ncbi:MAG: tautomerase family protein [Xanthobacteraceae bacterium]
MPMITVQYAALQAKAGLSQTVASTVTGLSADILHKDPAVTAVVIEEIDPAKWFIADISLAQHKRSAFWLDIRITDGTNTREEKSAFVSMAFKAMEKLIGPLHMESYVHVDEVRGDAYGYGGITQNARYFGALTSDTTRVAA